MHKDHRGQGAFEEPGALKELGARKNQEALE